METQKIKALAAQIDTLCGQDGNKTGYQVAYNYARGAIEERGCSFRTGSYHTFRTYSFKALKEAVERKDCTAIRKVFSRSFARGA